MQRLRILLAGVLFSYCTLAFSANVSVTGKVNYFTQWTSSLLIQLNTNNTANPANCTYTGYYTVPDASSNL